MMRREKRQLAISNWQLDPPNKRMYEESATRLQNLFRVFVEMPIIIQ